MGSKALRAVMVLTGIAVLTSGASVILAPLFVFKYIISRGENSNPLTQSRNLRIALVFTIGFVVQLLAKFYPVDDAYPRLSADYFQYLPTGLMRTFFYLFAENPTLPSSIFSILFSALAFLAFVRFRDIRVILLVAIYVGVVYTVLSLGMMSGGRYAFVPSVIVSLFVVNVMQRLTSRRIRYAALVLGIVFLAYRVQVYFDVERFYPDDWLEFSEEYARAVEAGSDRVLVFPQWEANDYWSIELREQSQ